MDHRRIDQRSLAFGRLIAARLRNDPELLAAARATLERWTKTCAPNVRTTLAEWEEALDGPLEGVLNLLTQTDERSTRLRQSNPFAGVLTTAERNIIIREFATHDSA